MSKPKITILCGIPCSGKTTYCSKQPKHVNISRDHIREKYWGKGYRITRDNENKVTNISNDTFKVATAIKENIIIDNTHCKQHYIDAWIDRKPETYDIEVIFFDISLWKAYWRNVLRYITQKKWIPFKVIFDMKRNYDKINKEKYGRNLSV